MYKESQQSHNPQYNEGGHSTEEEEESSGGPDGAQELPHENTA